MKKLFVGNLPWGVDDQQLEEMFAQYGAVASAKVIQDRDTGRSRGFGFVEMEEDAAADDAVDALDGSEVNGRPLRVNEANDRPPRREGGGGGGGNRGGGNRW
ncbi:MAG: RNA-binding protein [Bacteroidetes bacterium CG12_big_fil_rev_8_21_14_0_65_60_17]|nr:MAG: RNA-binding protein [Bacteroidetes bacterium CG12_big_fil_rev_8_21_14_0_65_60_17]